MLRVVAHHSQLTKTDNLGTPSDTDYDKENNTMSVDVIQQDRVALRTELLRILRGVLRDDVAMDDLDDEIPISDQVTMDSMDFLDFVIEIRKHLRVDIPEEDYAELVSIHGLLDYLTVQIEGLRS